MIKNGSKVLWKMKSQPKIEESADEERNLYRESNFHNVNGANLSNKTRIIYF